MTGTPHPIPTAAATHDHAVALIMLLSAGLVAMSAWSSLGSPDPIALPAGVRLGVDPNTAPWWELTALPGVGEATAGNIVAYRDARPGAGPVFRQLLDLEPVPRVGSKTLRRFAPHLRFDAR